MRGLTKYLLSILSISILLLTGYGQLHARAHHRITNPAVIQQYEQLFIKSAQPDQQKQNIVLNLLLFENEENDEVSSSKKHSKGDYYSASLSFTPLPVLFSAGGISILTSKYTLNVPSCLHLMYGVLRV